MKVVKVTTSHEGHLGYAVAAHVSGTWAAHRDIMESDDWKHCEQLWTVSDTRSGLAAVKNIDEGDALAIVRRLGRSIAAPDVPLDSSGRPDYDACLSNPDYEEFAHIVKAVIGEVLGG